MECHACARLELLAIRHQTEVEYADTTSHADRWVTVPRWIENWEVSKRFWAALASPMVYVGSHTLREPRSGWWVVTLPSLVIEM